MEIIFKKRHLDTNFNYDNPDCIGIKTPDYNVSNDYDGKNIKKSSEINTNDWIGELSHCPGINSILKLGYIYSLSYDLKFTYDGSNHSISPEQRYEDAVIIKSDPTRFVGSKGLVSDLIKNPMYKIDTDIFMITENGISTLIVEPFYRRNMNYSITPGLLNTDNYEKDGRMESVNLLNFFLTWDRDHEDELIIPARTPLAQIIPYKRK